MFEKMFWSYVWICHVRICHESDKRVPWKCHETAVNLPNLHETYMSDSSRIHVTFFQAKVYRSNSWQIHVTRHSLPKSIEKIVPITRFLLCVWIIWFFICHFCNMLDSCRLHRTFMQVSTPWFFGFLFFSLTKIQTNNFNQLNNGHLACMWHSSRIHVTFMLVS